MTEPIALNREDDPVAGEPAATSLHDALARVRALEVRCAELRQEREHAFLLLLKAQQELSERTPAVPATPELDDTVLDHWESDRVDLLQRTVDQMQNSSSWRITKPWRALGRLVHRALGR